MKMDAVVRYRQNAEWGRRMLVIIRRDPSLRSGYDFGGGTNQWFTLPGLGPMDVSPKGDLIEAARNLFASLRILDDDISLSCIISEPCPDNTGLAFVINDRLTRAAARFS